MCSLEEEQACLGFGKFLSRADASGGRLAKVVEGTLHEQNSCESSRRASSRVERSVEDSIVREDTPRWLVQHNSLVHVVGVSSREA